MIWNKKTHHIKKTFCYLVCSFLPFGVWDYFFSHLNSLSTLSNFCGITYFFTQSLLGVAAKNFKFAQNTGVFSPVLYSLYDRSAKTSPPDQ